MLRSVGIEFTASAMDLASVDFLHSIDVPFIKVIDQHMMKVFIMVTILYSGWLRGCKPFISSYEGKYLL